MDILESTQHVDLNKQKGSWIQLEVINQWDWKTKAICFQNLSGNIISYCLKSNTPKTGNSYKSEVIENITGKMKAKLIKMGYNV